MHLDILKNIPNISDYKNKIPPSTSDEKIKHHLLKHLDISEQKLELNECDLEFLELFKTNLELLDFSSNIKYEGNNDQNKIDSCKIISELNDKSNKVLF